MVDMWPCVLSECLRCCMSLGLLCLGYKMMFEMCGLLSCVE